MLHYTKDPTALILLTGWCDALRLPVSRRKTSGQLAEIVDLTS
jgi:hypothetical protein